MRILLRGRGVSFDVDNSCPGNHFTFKSLVQKKEIVGFQYQVKKLGMKDSRMTQGRADHWYGINNAIMNILNCISDKTSRCFHKRFLENFVIIIRISEGRPETKKPI